MRLPSKLGAVVLLVLLGLLASLTLSWTSRDLDVCGTSITLSGRALLGLALVCIAWSGTDLVVRQHARVTGGRLGLASSHSILPAMLTASAPVLLAQLLPSRAKMVGLAATGVLLGVLMACECYRLTWSTRSGAVIQPFLQLAAYLVAMLGWVAIRVLALGSLPHALGVATVGALCARRVLWAATPPGVQPVSGEDRVTRSIKAIARQDWPRAVTLGLVLSILAWPMHRWVTSPLWFAASLAVVLYVLAGLLNYSLSGRLTRALALEYLVIALLALVALTARSH